MKIYPTLNLQNGRVVAALGQSHANPKCPADLAAYLVDEGATRLALVDVDAAAGKGHNRDLIASILRRCHAQDRKVCVQVAGGIRSSDQAQFFIDLGATWLVAGTILHKSPLASEQLMARFQSFLTAAIDVRGGKVHHSGWVDTVGLSALELGLRAKAYGFQRLLFIDIPDHPKADPDFGTAKELADATGLPLIMGGSLSTHGHLEALRDRHGLKGALVDAVLFQGNPRLKAFLQAACA